jgi:hypothetical protein
MQAVGRVVRQVLEVHPCRLLEVVAGQGEMPDLGGEHGLRAGRQGRVAHGEALVVVEVPLFLLGCEGVPAPVHGHHQVGLLDHLLAVELEVRVVQQQRILVRRRVLEVPGLVLQEVLILRVQAALLVVGHVHGIGRPLPFAALRFIHPQARGRLRVPGGGLHGRAQVELRHQVRVDVVVHEGGVLVGSRHAVNPEVVAVVVVAEARP